MFQNDGKSTPTNTNSSDVCTKVDNNGKSNNISETQKKNMIINEAPIDHSPDLYTCDVCKTTFETLRDFSNHLPSSNANNLNSCTIYSLNRHNVNINRNDDIDNITSYGNVILIFDLSKIFIYTFH